MRMDAPWSPLEHLKLQHRKTAEERHVAKATPKLALALVGIFFSNQMHFSIMAWISTKIKSNGIQIKWLELIFQFSQNTVASVNSLKMQQCQSLPLYDPLFVTGAVILSIKGEWVLNPLWVSFYEPPHTFLQHGKQTVNTRKVLRFNTWLRHS